MKKHLTLLALILVSVVSLAQNAVPTETETYRFTLDQCLRYAFGNSYTRQSMKLTEQARQEASEQASLERLPDLNASAAETFTNTRNGSSWSGSAGASASVTLYGGSSIGSRIAAARLEAARSRLQTAQYDNNLTIQILQAFLTIIGNEELLTYQQALLATSEEQQRQGKAQLNAGTILPSDLLLLEAQLASAQSNIVDTRATRLNSLLILQNLMSMPPLAQLEIIYPHSPELENIALLPPLDEALDRAIYTLPERNISRQTIAIAHEGIKQARAAFLPTLSLGGSIGTAHTEFDEFSTQFSDRFNQQARLSLSIPLFNKNRNRLALSQSRIAEQKACLDSLQTDADLRQMVVRQYQNVQSLYQQYQASDLSRQAYERTYQAYQAKFDAGTTTPVDLLQQQNNYINSLNRYIQYKYGFLLNRKILGVYIGESISD